MFDSLIIITTPTGKKVKISFKDRRYSSVYSITGSWQGQKKIESIKNHLERDIKRGKNIKIEPLIMPIDLSSGVFVNHVSGCAYNHQGKKIRWACGYYLGAYESVTPSPRDRKEIKKYLDDSFGNYIAENYEEIERELVNRTHEMVVPKIISYSQDNISRLRKEIHIAEANIMQLESFCQNLEKMQETT